MKSVEEWTNEIWRLEWRDKDVLAKAIVEIQREAAEEMRDRCEAVAQEEFDGWREDVTNGADPYADDMSTGLCVSSDILKTIQALQLPENE